MHRGEMPLFIVRYGAAAIRIVTPRGGGSLTFPWRLQQTPGWDQFSGKGRGLFVSGPRPLWRVNSTQIDLFTGSLRQSPRGNEAMLFTKPFVYKTSLFNGIRQTAVMWWRHGRHGFYLTFYRGDHLTLRPVFCSKKAGWGYIVFVNVYVDLGWYVCSYFWIEFVGLCSEMYMAVYIG